MNIEHRTDPDRGDPIETAFTDYQRPPADIVPPRPRLEHSTADLAALAGKTVTVTSYDIDDDGVTKTVERATICPPITQGGTKNDRHQHHDAR